jgi:hypothetical protein
VSGLTGAALVRACASPPTAQPRKVATATAYTLRCLAQRIGQLTTQDRDLQRQITAVINTHAPQRVCRIERSPVIFAGRFTVSTRPAHPGPHGETSSAPPGDTRRGFRQ